MLISTLLFASMTALVKVAVATISIPEIILFRNLPSVLALYVFAYMTGKTTRTPHWPLHSVRCFVGVAGMGFGFYAIRELPLATAATLDYTAPLFLVTAHLLLCRRVGRLEIVAVIIGFGGVLLLLRPTLAADQVIPFASGLLGGGCAAVAYKFLRRLGEVGEPAWRIVFVYAVAGVLGAFLAIPFAEPSEYSMLSVAALVAIGATGLGAQLTMTHAFRTGPTSLLATLQYTTIIFSVCFGVLFWGEKPTAESLFGLTLIVVSGLFAAHGIANTNVQATASLGQRAKGQLPD